MFPEQHRELVIAAKAATEDGSLHDARWSLFKDEPRGVQEINPMRQHMTDCLGEAIYDLQHPECAQLGLAFYKALFNNFARFYGPGQVVVRLKGGNAAAFMMGVRYNNPTMLKADGFTFGDLDIDVLINPTMSKPEFDRVSATVKTVIGQTLAVHKRKMDKAFFKPSSDAEAYSFFATDELKWNFAERLCSKVATVAGAHCSMTSDVRRNQSSNVSYLITRSDNDSVAEPGTKRRLKIEQPHLDRAERVPLKFSPLYVTVNDTINCTRTDVVDGAEVETKVSFTLSRMKLSNLVVRPEATGRVRVYLEVGGADDRISVQIVVPYEKVSADFIDVWVGNQDDGELIDFERRGGFRGELTHMAHVFNVPVIMPTLAELRREYSRLLHVYDCPESKRERRERKLAAIDAVIARDRLLEIQRQMQLHTQRQALAGRVVPGPGRGGMGGMGGRF